LCQSKSFKSKIITYDVIVSFLTGYAMLVCACWDGNVALFEGRWLYTYHSQPVHPVQNVDKNI